MGKSVRGDRVVSDHCFFAPGFMNKLDNSPIALILVIVTGLPDELSGSGKAVKIGRGRAAVTGDDRC